MSLRALLNMILKLQKTMHCIEQKIKLLLLLVGLFLVNEIHIEIPYMAKIRFHRFSSQFWPAYFNFLLPCPFTYFVCSYFIGAMTFLFIILLACNSHTITYVFKIYFNWIYPLHYSPSFSISPS
jgi:hypothetical protein